MGISLAVYLPLGALGVAASIGLREDPGLFRPARAWLELSGWTAHGVSLCLGLTLALVTIASTRALTRTTSWARRLHLSFREVLGELSGPSILALALASGLGEEAFFRGGLQPSLGFVLTSLLFGLVHVGPRRQFLAWTAWAVVMGFAFGAIFEATGSIVGPVVAHVGINYANLRFIVDHDLRDRAEPTAPRLVAKRERR
ncbi:MAG: lysostaphin resistance A-like protein [Sandaracinaceae bacterium]